MSKEKKLAKKEAKAQKKAAKIEKQQAKAYAKLVKDIEKKNAKVEKKANKKGKPFVPVAIPTMEEAFASGQVNKKKQVVKMIILLLLIAYVIYFLVMWFTYVAPIKNAVDDNGEDDSSSVAQEYDRYVSDKQIMETPTYQPSEAKNLLKQVIHDNWQDMGFKSDVSSNSINQTGTDTVNNTRCYIFSCSGKKFAVSEKLQSVYLMDNGTAVPFTFHGTKFIIQD